MTAKLSILFYLKIEKARPIGLAFLVLVKKNG